MDSHTKKALKRVKKALRTIDDLSFEVITDVSDNLRGCPIIRIETSDINKYARIIETLSQHSIFMSEAYSTTNERLRLSLEYCTFELTHYWRD